MWIQIVIVIWQVWPRTVKFWHQVGCQNYQHQDTHQFLWKVWLAKFCQSDQDIVTNCVKFSESGDICLFGAGVRNTHHHRVRGPEQGQPDQLELCVGGVYFQLLTLESRGATCSWCCKCTGPVNKEFAGELGSAYYTRGATCAGQQRREQGQGRGEYWQPRLRLLHWQDEQESCAAFKLCGNVHTETSDPGGPEEEDSNPSHGGVLWEGGRELYRGTVSRWVLALLEWVEGPRVMAELNLQILGGSEEQDFHPSHKKYARGREGVRGYGGEPVSDGCKWSLVEVAQMYCIRKYNFIFYMSMRHIAGVLLRNKET